MGIALIMVGLLVFLAHFFAVVFRKSKVPDVLLLMLIGILIGPILGLISTEDLGKVGSVFTSITLVVILFEGGLDISINHLRESWKLTLHLTVSSFFLSTFLSAAIGIAFGMPILQSLTLGFILGGTSSAVVIPLTRMLKMGTQTKTALVLESALTDVFCIIFALSVLEATQIGKGVDVGDIIGSVISSFVVSIVVGFVAAILWASVLRRIRTIQNSMFLTPSFLFIVYGFCEVLNFSGAIASLAVGITISNIEFFKLPFLRKLQKNEPPARLNDREHGFISEIAFFLKTFFFVFIGVSIPFNNIGNILIGLAITLVLLVMRMFVAKFFSPSKSNTFDRSVCGLMIPKGLAAAVLASMPEQMGIPFGAEIKGITYSVVLMSILFSSLGVLLIEKYPKVGAFLRLFFAHRVKGETGNMTQVTQNVSKQMAEENRDKISHDFE